MDFLRSLGYEIEDVRTNRSYIEIKLSEANLDMKTVKQDFREHIEEFLIFLGKEHLYDGLNIGRKDNAITIGANKQFLEIYPWFLEI